MPLKLQFVLPLVLLALMGPSLAAQACGGEVSCQLDGGEYFVLSPREGNAPASGWPAIFYLHGHRGKAINAIRNNAFQTLSDELGVKFVAVQGVEGTWSFPTAPRALRDEFGFFDRLMADLVAKHDVDPERTLLSGFSSGAFMTWYLACDDPDRFAGYAPVAGAFWDPLPSKCASGAPYLFHVHGRADEVVPLEGRPLGGGRWHQGDLFESFDVWRRQLGLAEVAGERDQDGLLSCESWKATGGLLELCLHEGGHSIRAEWLRRAWSKLSELKGWSRS